MNTNYHKYQKYKTKYLELQKQIGGACTELKDKKYQARPSPPYHANDCKGKIMEGNDGNQYLSVSDKRGIYHWKKLKDEEEAKSAEEYWSQFTKYEPKYNIKPILDKLNKINKELEKSNIFLIHIGWYKVWDTIDNAWDDAKMIIAKKLKIEGRDAIRNIINTNSFMLYTDNGIYRATIDGTLNIQHNILKKDKQIVIDKFKEYFGASFKWSGDIRKTIDIKLPKIMR